jgi:hypothetical protein
MSRFEFLLLLTLLTGCTVADPASREVPSFQEVSLNEEFILAPGTRATVDDRMTVRFDTVFEDSRCPIGATCVWEGDAAVGLQYQSPDHPPVRFVLHTSKRYIRDTTIQGHRIQLIGVEPHPVVDQQIDHSAYQVKLQVEHP